MRSDMTGLVILVSLPMKILPFLKKLEVLLKYLRTLGAWRKVIQANGGITPKEVTADLGNEWALLEQEIASKGGVLRRKNMQAANTLAVVDRVVGKLKVILSGYVLTD